MDKKGQSALEYLMTYGWALVVIIIVIAALFAFGIFNPPSAGTCTGLDKFLYKDHTVSGGTVILVLGNGAGSTITLSGNPEYGGDFSDVTFSVNPISSDSAGTGADFNVTATGFTGTGSYAGTITITYISGSGLTHTETATCTGSV